MAVQCEEIMVDGEPRTGAQIFGVANPKAGAVGGANRSSFQEFGPDDMESLFLGRRKQEGLWRRQICVSHFKLRSLSLGKCADANRKRCGRFFCRVPQNLHLHGFARKIKRERWANCEIFGTTPRAFGKRANQSEGFVACCKLRIEFGGKKHPTATVESVSQMIDSHGGRG